MVEDIDVWRVAQQLIHQYGDKADDAASRFLTNCKNQGTIEGVTFWERVRNSIVDLQNTTPRGRIN